MTEVDLDARDTATVGGRIEAIERVSFGGLEAHIDASRQRVEGGFDEVRFEAELAGEGQARARFEGAGGVSLTVVIQGPRSGAVEWRGTSIDGEGAPTDAELEALIDLERRLPARTLALIPLDLACEPGAENLEPAVGAALLMPFQMLLKYRTPSAVLGESIDRMARSSKCQYFVSPLGEHDRARTPSAAVVVLGFEQPIPMAYGYFPFDGVGQAP